MTNLETFYVIYDSSTEQYRNEDGDFGIYTEAEKFEYPDRFCILENGQRWVGPLAVEV